LPCQLFQLRPFQLRLPQFCPFQLCPLQFRPLHEPIPGRPEAKLWPPLKWLPPPRGAAVANGELSAMTTKQLKESTSFEQFILSGVSND
jgi:hypothetical protein